MVTVRQIRSLDGSLVSVSARMLWMTLCEAHLTSSLAGTTFMSIAPSTALAIDPLLLGITWSCEGRQSSWS